MPWCGDQSSRWKINRPIFFQAQHHTHCRISPCSGGTNQKRYWGFSLHKMDTFLMKMSAAEYKNSLLLNGFWNILKILKTTFILALCSPLPNSASGCCGSFYTSTTAAAHCHTSVNIQQWRRRRQRSGEAAQMLSPLVLSQDETFWRHWYLFLWLWVGFLIQCLQFWANLCLAVAMLLCPSQTIMLSLFKLS